MMENDGVEVPLVDDLDQWENERPSEETEEETTESEINPENFSETAIGYLSQMKDLQEQLKLEYLKVQRLEMAIKGFGVSLQEELKKGQ